MKKGIVRVPEWAKEAFKNGAEVIETAGIRLIKKDLSQDGEELSKNERGFWIDKNGESWPPSWIEPIEERIDPRRLKDGCPLIYDPLGNCGSLVEFAKRDSDYPETLLYTWKRSVNEVAFKAEDCSFPQGVNPEDWYK